MAISLKHAFTSAKSDGVDSTQVQPSNWNAEHALTLAADKLLGRDASGAGAVQEIACTAYGRSIIAAADVTAWKTATGLQASSMTWTEAHTHNASLTASQAVFLTGTLSPTGLAGDTNDWAPTSFATSNHVRIGSAAHANLTGLAGGAAGRVVVLTNVSAFVVTLVDESSSSTDANRFALAQNIQIRPDESVTLIYDATSSRWRVPTKSTTKAPTVQRLTSGSAATYTTPAGCTYLRVRMVGPGGGGGSTGSAAWGAAANGGASTNTSFGSTTAVYGSGAATMTVAGTCSAGGVGGTGGTTGTGTEITRHAGSNGSPGGMPYGNNVGTGAPEQSGGGGHSVFGGGGKSVPNGSTSAAGTAGATNSGSGGASAYTNTAGFATGGGGGAGEYVEFYVYAPAATYSYTVPAGGAGGTAGTSGHAGGAGAAGLIIVEEFYT